MARIRIRDNNRIPEANARLRELNGTKIRVGVLTPGENQKLASIHEFGLRIMVTDKMRKWLAVHGLHLKKSTTHIVIPERSFIRAGFDAHVDELHQLADSMAEDVVTGGISVDEFLDRLGAQMKGNIQEFAIELSQPGNHPFTIERKNSSNPLVQSGGMVQSIDYKVEK